MTENDSKLPMHGSWLKVEEVKKAERGDQHVIIYVWKKSPHGIFHCPHPVAEEALRCKKEWYTEWMEEGHYYIKSDFFADLNNYMNK
jgi:hypothetical protein